VNSLRRTLTAALILIMVLALGGIAWGAADTPATRAAAPENWVNLVQSLGLTDEQAQKMRDLQSEFHRKMQAQRNKLQDIMFELRQMQFERDPDMNKVRQKLQEANTLRTQMRELAGQHREQMQSILTPEQQQKWKQFCPGPRGFGMMHGKGGPGPMMGAGPGPRCPFGNAQGTGN